jgi:hypothetical protein
MPVVGGGSGSGMLFSPGNCGGCKCTVDPSTIVGSLTAATNIGNISLGFNSHVGNVWLWEANPFVTTTLCFFLGGSGSDCCSSGHLPVYMYLTLYTNAAGCQCAVLIYQVFGYVCGPVACGGISNAQGYADRPCPGGTSANCVEGWGFGTLVSAVTGPTLTFSFPTQLMDSVGNPLTINTPVVGTPFTVTAPIHGTVVVS